MPAKGWKHGESILGRRYGLWLVQAAAPSGPKCRKWLAACDCGTFRILSTQQVTRAARQARPGGCGCSVRNEGYPTRQVKPSDARWLAIRYRAYRQRALQKLEVAFELSSIEFKALALAKCNYCGSAPHMLARFDRSRPDEPLVNGVDRVDSSQGYTLGNCVPCCTVCNEMKLDRTAADFLAHARRIAEFQSR